jgi:hypothetical protein
MEEGLRSKEDLREEGRDHATAIIEYGADFGPSIDDIVREIEAQVESSEGANAEVAEVLRGAADYFAEIARALRDCAAAREGGS